MKLVYIHSTEITSGKANVVQAISMCEAFASKGIDVELVTPYPKEKIVAPDEYLAGKFGIKNKIDISFYHKIELFNRLDMLGSYFGVRKFIKKSTGELFFTRCPLILTLLTSKNMPVIFEAHNTKIHYRNKFLDSYWSKKIIKASKMNSFMAFISISKKLGDFWEKKGVPNEKILPLHDGFSSQLFQENVTRHNARIKLNLPGDKKIVTYSGSLYPDRNIEKIIDLAKYFPRELFIVIGGPKENADFYQSLAKETRVANIQFTGPVKHTMIPYYLYASDVLLALWSKKVPTINYCSPLKIFEYMAAGRIIVAHGFPTIKEVIRHEENGLLVTPDDFNDLVEKTDMALYNTNLKGIEKQARSEAFEKYKWVTRAAEILEKVK